jgi:hypothetical protein
LADVLRADEGGGAAVVRRDRAPEPGPGVPPPGRGVLVRNAGGAVPSVRGGVVIAELVVAGPRAREVVERSVRRGIGQLAHCYEVDMARDPGLAGRVRVRWDIGADGRATTIEVLRGVRAATVGDCFAARVGGWRFTGSAPGATAVTAAFDLSPR